FSSAKAITTNVVALTADGFPRAGEDGILPGDEIYSINGERVYFASDFSMILSRDGDGLVDLVIRRDGKKLEYEDFPLSLREYTEDDGTVSVRYGVTFTVRKADAASKLRASCWQVIDFVRMIKFGLADLIAGKAGVDDFSGPVGIVSTMNEAAKSAPTVIEALAEFAYICAFIAVNLAVMNLLPIPALDGGRIFLGIISWLITVIFGKRIDPKYEGIIHTVFLVLMLGFTVYVMVNDVIKVIHG
ncbi:MAG: site-2 protease family protein, partial [Oscillospiraceae bacterium]|nr:site-2 protease family protein [Oscillospiraceae bacterium]